jgi:hypothetical protein
MKLAGVNICRFVYIVVAKSLLELRLVQIILTPNLLTYNIIAFKPRLQNESQAFTTLPVQAVLPTCKISMMSLISS